MSTSSTIKSLSLTVPCVSETFFNPRLLRNIVRPLSLDLSYQSEQTYSKASTESILNTASSTTNSLPLPPRRRRDRIYSLQGDEPPPRYLLGPKPDRFKALSADSKLFSDNQGSKLSMEITPIIEVTRHFDVPNKCAEIANDNDYNFSLDVMFVVNIGSSADAETEIDLATALEEGHIKYIDDASPDSTDAETQPSNTGNVDSDAESQRSVPESQVDIQSESSVDTVATAVEVRERSAVHSTDVPIVSDDNACTIHNPSYDSLNTYELLSTDRKLSVIDESNPKLAKDLKNKMSKESTYRLSKNLAAEITDFFKSSASKLKPPCLDQAKKDFADTKLNIDRDVTEPCVKTPQRLIPRSPYITPVPMFEQKMFPRKTPPVKQPPFYVWNINSKNAAVCTTLNPPVNYRTSGNDEAKALKDIENSTRKILDLAKRSNGVNTTRVSPMKTERDSKSASTGQLSAKAQRDFNMSHAQSNDSQIKPRLSLNNKTVTNPRPSPNRLLVPRASPWDRSPAKSHQEKAFKFQTTKNLPKINIPLPSPHITVAKVKTQLPCDFSAARTCDNIAKPCASTSEGSGLQSVTVSVEPVTKKSWVKKWRSVIQDLFGKHQVEFYIDGVPPCYNYKRSNTWPPKKNQVADNSSTYKPFK